MGKAKPVHLLYMEDESGVARLVQKKLKEAGYEVDIARDGEEGLNMCAAGAYDVVLVDQVMPVYEGLEVISILASRGGPPSIMVTGRGSESIAVEAMKRGAGDYVIKDSDQGFLELLPGVIQRLLEHQQLFEQKQEAEAALNRQRLQYEMILNSLGEGIVCVDTQGRITFVNPEAQEKCGHTAEELLGRAICDLIHVHPREDCPLCATSIDGKVRHIVDEVFWSKEGKAFPVEYVTTPLMEHGRLVGAATIFRYITERRQAEEALRESEQRFRLMADNIQDAFWIATPEIDKMVYVSPGYELIWGRTCQELYQSPRAFLEAIHPEEQERVKSEITSAKEQGIPWSHEYRIIRPDGTGRWVQGRGFPVQDAQDRVIMFTGVATDITERKLTNEAFKKLVVKAPIGIFIVQNREIKVVNPGFLAITGYREDELIGKDSCSYIAPGYEKFVRENISCMLKGLSSLPFEFQIINKGGEKKWVMESVTPIEHEGEPAIVVYMMDISGYKDLEAELRQAQKMEAVGLLAGGVAHDFNNILTAIMGNIGLAMLDEQIGSRVQERLVLSEQACLRAQALAQQLLTFAKGGAPIKKIVSISQLLKEVAGLTLSGSQSRGEFSIPGDLWSVEADGGQISQVFNNLLINADQSMPEGGIITVGAENILGEAEADLPNPKGKYVKLSFTDQGVGISTKYIDKIFDPYFSTKQKGSGLGLATAYSIIKNHSGLIKVKSRIEVGTTFTIYLPALEEGAPGKQETSGSVRGQGRVLVMDDEEMVRQVSTGMLDYLGYEADFASDGSQAIEKFVKAQAAGRPFAVVILDLTIPGGMGGKEAIKELLKIDPQVKAIVSSGYSDDPIMADFQKYGFCEVIAKPYRIVELSKKLQKIMSKAN